MPVKLSSVIDLQRNNLWWKELTTASYSISWIASIAGACVATSCIVTLSFWMTWWRSCKTLINICKGIKGQFPLLISMNPGPEHKLYAMGSVFLYLCTLYLHHCLCNQSNRCIVLHYTLCLVLCMDCSGCRPLQHSFDLQSTLLTDSSYNYF